MLTLALMGCKLYAKNQVAIPPYLQKLVSGVSVTLHIPSGTLYTLTMKKHQKSTDELLIKSIC